MPLRSLAIRTAAIMLAASGLLSTVISSALAQSAQDEKTRKGYYGLKDAATDALLPTGTTDEVVIIGNALNILLGLLGVLFLVLMIYGGFLWMTAQGNEEQVGKAKTLIRNAVIGLLVVVFSFIITTFLFGSKATIFS